jgi:hypothetical protein
VKRRRINIEIWDQNITLAEAVRLVAAVIEQGRISDDGNCFCYATTFRNVAVEAKTNKLDDRSERSTSDSFRVFPLSLSD